MQSRKNPSTSVRSAENTYMTEICFTGLAGSYIVGMHEGFREYAENP